MISRRAGWYLPQVPSAKTWSQRRFFGPKILRHAHAWPHVANVISKCRHAICKWYQHLKPAVQMHSINQNALALKRPDPVTKRRPQTVRFLWANLVGSRSPFEGVLCRIASPWCFQKESSPSPWWFSPPIWKICAVVKLEDETPRIGMKIRKYLKRPPSLLYHVIQLCICPLFFVEGRNGSTPTPFWKSKTRRDSGSTVVVAFTGWSQIEASMKRATKSWSKKYGCWTKNNGKTTQIIHLFIGFSIMFTIHFGLFPPIFGLFPKNGSNVPNKPTRPSSQPVTVVPVCNPSYVPPAVGTWW